jgi:dTDP-4-dehydrorhamnose reductase
MKEIVILSGRGGVGKTSLTASFAALVGNVALVDWFLAQQGRVKGYRRAIFSGLPTVELARVMRDVVLPRSELHGLYHVSAPPIAKYDLLGLIAQQYGKHIEIDGDDLVAIDRSLDSSRFTLATGYRAPEWPALIAFMQLAR